MAYFLRSFVILFLEIYCIPVSHKVDSAARESNRLYFKLTPMVAKYSDFASVLVWTKTMLADGRKHDVQTMVVLFKP